MNEWTNELQTIKREILIIEHIEHWMLKSFQFAGCLTSLRMDARSWPALSIRGIISSNNISLHQPPLLASSISLREKFSMKGTWLIKVWVDSSSFSLAWPQSRVGRQQAASGRNDAQWACFIPIRGEIYFSVLSNSCKSDNGVARLKGSVHRTPEGASQQPIREQLRKFWPMRAGMWGPTWSAASLPGVVQDPMQM